MRPLQNILSSVKDASGLGLTFALYCLCIPIFSIFNARAISPLVGICGLIAVIILIRRKSFSTIFRFDRWISLFLFGYFFAVCFSGIGVEETSAAIKSISKLFGIILISIILISAQKELPATDATIIGIALLIGFSFSLLWILIEGLSGGLISHMLYGFALDHYTGQFWLKSSSAVLVVSSFVVGVFFTTRGKYSLALGSSLAAAIASYSIQSLTAAFGVILSLVFGIAYQAMGSFRLKITALALVLTFLMPMWISLANIAPEKIGPLLSHEQSSSYSIVYRSYIWKFTVDHIVQKPLLGWGVGASKKLGTDKVGIVTDPVFGRFGEPIPLHPHNSVLQIWLEFGLLGAFFACALLIRSIYLLDKLIDHAPTRVWAFSLFTLFMCFFNFSYSMSSSWWMSGFVAWVAISSFFCRLKALER